MFISYTPPVSAKENTPNPLQTREQRAQRLYNTGEYGAAAELFQHPMRRGNAYYRAGEYDAAIRAFQQLDSAEGWYNLGNSYAHAGELEAASQAYAEALQRRPGWQQATDNKEIVDELLNQQSAESSGDESDKDQQQEQQPEHEDEDTESTEQNNTDDEQDQAEGENEDNETQTAEAESAEDGQQEEVLEYEYTEDELTDEERQEMEQLLRSLPDDPSTLLRNRMRMEAERRQTGQPPRGARQQW